jgi:hypothetical protein
MFMCKINLFFFTLKVKGIISVLGFQGFDLIPNRLLRIAHAKTCLWEAITGLALRSLQLLPTAQTDIFSTSIMQTLGKLLD